jgi:hypothetical protein
MKKQNSVFDFIGAENIGWFTIEENTNFPFTMQSQYHP